jgi:hypothetical protein
MRTRTRMTCYPGNHPIHELIKQDALRCEQPAPTFLGAPGLVFLAVTWPLKMLKLKMFKLVEPQPHNPRQRYQHLVDDILPSFHSSIH